jgi:hypothetical protein
MAAGTTAENARGNNQSFDSPTVRVVTQPRALDEQFIQLLEGLAHPYLEPGGHGGDCQTARPGSLLVGPSMADRRSQPVANSVEDLKGPQRKTEDGTNEAQPQCGTTVASDGGTK